MLMHFIGWLYAFLMAAALSTGITLSPIAVTWNSIWVYVTFGLCLIPGYILAWLTIMVIIFLIGALGACIFGGGIAALSKKNDRDLQKKREEVIKAHLG